MGRSYLFGARFLLETRQVALPVFVRAWRSGPREQELQQFPRSLISHPGMASQEKGNLLKVPLA